MASGACYINNMLAAEHMIETTKWDWDWDGRQRKAGSCRRDETLERLNFNKCSYLSQQTGPVNW